MRKFSLLIASVLLSTGITQAYADQDVTCPSIWEMRNNGGSQFTHAFLNGDEWTLISSPFMLANQSVWQTTYRVKLADVIDPVTAVAVGQRYFDKSPLRTVPINNGTHQDMPVYCFYEPDDANYLVTASNSVDYGIKSR